MHFITININISRKNAEVFVITNPSLIASVAESYFISDLCAIRRHIPFAHSIGLAHTS